MKILLRTNVLISVRTSNMDIYSFTIRTRLHQRSTLSTYLFAFVMNKVTWGVQGNPLVYTFCGRCTAIVVKSRIIVNREIELW
jgi:hypothetical protein